MEFDAILTKYVGEFGRYQRFLVLLFSIEEMFMAMNTLSVVFIASIPDHYCDTGMRKIQNCSDEQLKAYTLPRELRNDVNSFSRCLMYRRNDSALEIGDICPIQDVNNAPPLLFNGTEEVACASWIYEMPATYGTVVTEWNLVCGNAVLGASFSAVFMSGWMVGNFILGHLVERFGRKPMLVIAGLLNCVAGIGVALSPYYIMVLVFRFFHAAFAGGKTIASNVLAMEFTGITWRMFVGMMYYVGWGCGFLVLSGVAYFIRYWRWLQLTISAVEACMYIAFIWLIPESPRWLLVQNKKKEANDVILRIAKGNGTEVPTQSDVTVPVVQKSKGTLLEIIRPAPLRWMALLIYFLLWTNSFLYYGLSFNTGNLSTDPYVSMAIFGVAEVAGYISTYIVSKKMGRIRILCPTMSLAVVVLIVTAMLPAEMQILGTVFGMLGKFFVTISFGVVYIVALELFPTSVRSVGLSTCQIASRVGALLASYSTLMFDINISMGILLIAVPAGVATLFTIALPETKGAPLRQTAQEGAAFAAENSCIPCKKLRHCRSHHLPAQQHGGTVTPV